MESASKEADDVAVTARLIRSYLTEALQTLSPPGTTISIDVVEEWVLLILESYSNPNRVYHGVQHVLDVCNHAIIESNKNNNNPLSNHHFRAVAIIAALFHDIIYLPLDGALSQRQSTILLGRQDNGRGGGVPSLSDGEAILRHLLKQKEATTRATKVVQMVFGYNINDDGGNEEKLSGTNEALSAIVAAKLLLGDSDDENNKCSHNPTIILPKKDVLQIVACIEATIPFRPCNQNQNHHHHQDDSNDHDDKSPLWSTAPMVRLYQRCRDFCEQSEAELIATVQAAATFANCDLNSFSNTDRRAGLDTTWKLLPEWVPELLVLQQQQEGGAAPPLAGELVTWCDALQLLCRNCRATPVENIFQSFHGVPSNIESMRLQAKDGLVILGQYAHARLFAARVVLDLLQQVIAEQLPETSDETMDKNEYLSKRTADLGTFALMRRINAIVRDSEGCHHHGALSSTEEARPDGWNKDIDDDLANGRLQSFPFDEADAPFTLVLYRKFGSTITEPKPQTAFEESIVDADLKEIVKQAVMVDLIKKK